MVVIPGGLTSQLQPLDVSINKPLNTVMKEEWNQLMTSPDHDLTPTGLKSFKICGISNSLDGTENDILFDDSESSHSFNDSDDTDDCRELYGFEETKILETECPQTRLFAREEDSRGQTQCLSPITLPSTNTHFPHIPSSRREPSEKTRMSLPPSPDGLEGELSTKVDRSAPCRRHTIGGGGVPVTSHFISTLSPTRADSFPADEWKAETLGQSSLLLTATTREGEILFTHMESCVRPSRRNRRRVGINLRRHGGCGRRLSTVKRRMSCLVDCYWFSLETSGPVQFTMVHIQNSIRSTNGLPVSMAVALAGAHNIPV
ncbi:hypothetical protein J437_LFUL015638 [Ladona fulva]|uniref:Uncharacterized protein n=1 Tax=Ladona fulva TaxID=123851 RepID=A0A8K0KLJ5_LADFU|nr:hypothetical protein J437_LFUL015638 [Ladona fulva]